MLTGQLIAAIKGKNPSAAKVLIQTIKEEKATPKSENDINWADEDGYTAFTWAAYYGFSDLIPDLLAAGGNPYLAFPPNYRTPLHNAIEQGQLSFIEELAKYCSLTKKVQQVDKNLAVSESKDSLLEFQDKDSYRPLALAASCAHVDIVKYLVEQKADVNALGKDHFSPVFCAVEGSKKQTVTPEGRAERSQIITLLRRAGAKVNQPISSVCEETHKRRILQPPSQHLTYHLASLGHLGADAAMIQSRLHTKPKSCDRPKQQTALHLAASRGDFAMMEALCAEIKGTEAAKIHAVDHEYRSALDMVLLDPFIFDSTRAQCIAVLFRYAEFKPIELAKALGKAVERGNQETINLLLKSGADPEMSKLWELTLTAKPEQIDLDKALRIAITKGYEETASSLVAKGADLNYAEESREGKVSNFKIAALKKQKNDPQFLRTLCKTSQTPPALPIQELTLKDAFFAAATEGHGNTVQFMLEAKLVSITMHREGDNMTVLHLASASEEYRHSNVVELLCARLDVQNIINALTKNGDSALYLATLHDNSKAVRALLDAGAEIDPETLELDEDPPTTEVGKLLVATKLARAERTEQVFPAEVKTEREIEMYPMAPAKTNFLDIWKVIKHRDTVFEEKTKKMAGRLNDPIYATFLLALKFMSEKDYLKGAQHLRICLRLAKDESELLRLFSRLLESSDPTNVEIDQLLLEKMEKLYLEFKEYIDATPTEFERLQNMKQSFQAQVSKVISPGTRGTAPALAAPQIETERVFLGNGVEPSVPHAQSSPSAKLSFP